jgi:hypothetical protein
MDVFMATIAAAATTDWIINPSGWLFKYKMLNDVW